MNEIVDLTHSNALAGVTFPNNYSKILTVFPLVSAPDTSKHFKTFVNFSFQITINNYHFNIKSYVFQNYYLLSFFDLSVNGAALN